MWVKSTYQSYPRADKHRDWEFPIHKWCPWSCQQSAHPSTRTPSPPEPVQTSQAPNSSSLKKDTSCRFFQTQSNSNRRNQRTVETSCRVGTGCGCRSLWPNGFSIEIFTCDGRCARWRSIAGCPAALGFSWGWGGSSWTGRSSRCIRLSIFRRFDLHCSTPISSCWNSNSSFCTRR